MHFNAFFVDSCQLGLPFFPLYPGGYKRISLDLARRTLSFNCPTLPVAAALAPHVSDDSVAKHRGQVPYPIFKCRDALSRLTVSIVCRYRPEAPPLRSLPCVFWRCPEICAKCPHIRPTTPVARLTHMPILVEEEAANSFCISCLVD